MSIRGIESAILSYEDLAVAAAVDSTFVGASETATKQRLIHGISLSSNQSKHEAAAAAVRDEYILNAEISFSGLPRKNGRLLTLGNAVTVTQQGAITPNTAIVEGSKNAQIMFSDPVIWPEGASINLIVDTRNAGTGTTSIEVEGTVLYTD